MQSHYRALNNALAPIRSRSMSKKHPHMITSILPCQDIEISTAFYERLGLRQISNHRNYRILGDDDGWRLHLAAELPDGWIVPERNPFGIYLYCDDIDRLAANVQDLLIGGEGPEHKPWGMYEFAVSDPDGTLVRIGSLSEDPD